MSPIQIPVVTGTGTVEVHVNTNTGSVTVNPPSMKLADQGAKVNYTLSFEPGSPNQAGVRAYVMLRKHNVLAPTDATKNDGYQDTVFALEDTSNNALKPTFVPQSQGEARLVVEVMFPEGIDQLNAQAESVVIVDW